MITTHFNIKVKEIFANLFSTRWTITSLLFPLLISFLLCFILLCFMLWATPISTQSLLQLCKDHLQLCYRYHARMVTDKASTLTPLNLSGP